MNSVARTMGVGLVLCNINAQCSAMLAYAPPVTYPLTKSVDVEKPHRTFRVLVLPIKPFYVTQFVLRVESVGDTGLYKYPILMCYRSVDPTKEI